MTKGSSGYASFHTHSDMSNLDGAGTMEEYAKVAQERGDPAIAFSDHGSMRGIVRQHDACEEVGIKPIYGIEFYVSRDMSRRGVTDEERAEITKGLKKQEASAAVKAFEEREGIRDRWHTTVWAMDQEGLQNLFRLSSEAWLEGFYYKPRIDIDRLIKRGKGLMVSTGCLNSPINDLYIQGKKRESRETFERLVAAFGDRLVLEIQPHDLKDQIAVNLNLLKLRERYGGEGPRLLAAQDAHYVHRSDAEHHEVLLCIGTKSVMSQPKGDGRGERFAFDGDEFHFRDRREMIRAFGRHHSGISAKMLLESLNSTVDFADRCTAKLDINYHKGLLPAPDIPKEYAGDTFRRLKDLCIDGWSWRRMKRRIKQCAAREGISIEEAGDLYRKRLAYELGVLKKQKFAPYFLIVWDLYRFARERKIMVGPGRGSVAGSLVAYLIGITSVDPIEHHLIFERFINPDRVDFPDIDQDYEDVRRQEIIQYLRDTYGVDKVAQIATIGKLSGKECINSVSRVLEIPLIEVKPVTKAIIERSSGDERASQTIEDSFRDFEVCKKFNEKYPDVLRHSKRLEGLSKNLGIHAAGVVTSPVPLIEVVPLEVRTSGGEKKVVTALDMESVAALGLVKLDILGLRTLTVIRDANDAIENRHGKRIDFEDPMQVPLDDERVLQAFTDHDYVGIFQYDTPSADKVCQGVSFDSFEDVAAMTALNRPGTSRSGLAAEYVRRKKNPELASEVHFHEKVSEITKDTLGILVYQEHIIRIFTECAGFAPGTADSLRKAIAKKYGDETIGKERERFVAGCAKHSGFKESTSNKIFNAITFFGCVPGETLIATPDGPRRIDQLRETDEVWSCSPQNGDLSKNRIRAIGPSGHKEVFRIKFGESGMRAGLYALEGVASADHWWMLNDGSYKRTRELAIGDVLHHVTRPIGAFVTSVVSIGEMDTFDLECQQGPANYVMANGLVSHNSYGFNKSHSTSYGMIAYWCQWLKTYYPLEFYYGLLKNEPEAIRIQSIAKDAKNHGVELLAPDVSTSAKSFVIDGERIRGSLIDIKGVGDKAAEAVIEGQPYKSFVDFGKRINRRRVNRGTVAALVRSGAMDNLIPNVRWMIENLDKVWTLIQKKPDEAKALVKSSKDEKDFDPDDRAIIASKANPLAFGKHPIEAYKPFLESLPIKVVDSSGEDFLEVYNGKSVFVAGIFTEVRYNQIGDFHSGPAPDAETMRHMFWGERYANCTIEDAGGRQHRCRFDIEVFDTHRSVIDRGAGAPVLVFATASNFTTRLWARFVVSIDEARELSKKIHDGTRAPELISDMETEASLWWRLIHGFHPAKSHPWKAERSHERRTNEKFWKTKGRGTYCGVIVNIKRKYDKRGGLMAFMGIYGPEARLIELVIFSRDWAEIEKSVEVGSLVVVDVEKQKDEERGSTYIFSDGRFRVVKRSC